MRERRLTHEPIGCRIIQMVENDVNSNELAWPFEAVDYVRRHRFFGLVPVTMDMRNVEATARQRRCGRPAGTVVEAPL